MKLYSFRGQYPEPLPERIRLLSNRFTRTDSSTFTDEEIANAGYVLAPPMPVRGIYQHLSWNQNGWVVTDFSPQEIKDHVNREWLSVRQKRNQLLQETDWVAIRAMEMQTDMDEKFKQYRQNLRDITLNSDPYSIIWPTIPS